MKELTIRIIQPSKLSKDQKAKTYKEYYGEQEDLHGKALRGHYLDTRPVIDITQYIKVIEPPKLTDKQKKKIHDTPVYKRIGMTEKQYNNNDLIKEHEKVFVERFTDLGHKIKWVSRTKKKKSGTGYLPTNDFIWNDKEWECKSISNQKYSSISRRLRIPISQGKENFFLVMQNKILATKLSKQLASFNLRKQERRIERLIVWDKEGIKEISLLEKK